MATAAEIKEFRDGIFALRTRRFGTVAEIMIKYLYNMSESNDLAFDKYSETEGRVEVKFSTVMKENDDKIRDTNVIDQCKKANLANRAMVSADDQVLECTGYSNKQHRGNEGEGQFHLNQNTIRYHKEHYLKKKLSYEDLYDLFSKIK